MKEVIIKALNIAIDDIKQQAGIVEMDISIKLDRTKDKQHGDFATNIALVLAKAAQQKPRDLAEKVIDLLPPISGVEKVEIAGPGFINFFLADEVTQSVITKVLTEQTTYGNASYGDGEMVLVEFVSANPTGPLHVGHGRGAAFGDTLCNILQAVGYQVHREYYVNDAGRQMDILTVSVWLRYMQLLTEYSLFPCNGYKGHYVIELAEELKTNYADRFVRSIDDIYSTVPADEDVGGDREKHIDGLINALKQQLGTNEYDIIAEHALKKILAGIEDDLTVFGVNIDEWFSEKALLTGGHIDHAVDVLKKQGLLYEKGGALWFKATDFDDEKDRVVKRDNGQYTYFASDIAYHLNKYERNNRTLFDIFGADHHGYIARLRAALDAFGYEKERFIPLLVQFAILYRGKEKVAMSTRSGEFVTLRALVDEVGRDAARFFYVMRKSEQHMDFDLELAKSQSNDNPVYYIQYAHARVSSVVRKMASMQVSFDEKTALKSLNLLTEPQEQVLMEKLVRFPDTVLSAAKFHEPHVIAHFLREIAGDFHAYYNAHRVLVDNEALCQARLALSLATQQVIHNGLKLLGVSAPNEM